MSPPQLDLVAERHAHAGTRLTRRRAAYPYVVTQPFKAPGSALQGVILQSASGAVIAGDRLRQRVTVREGAALLVTTASASLIHGMPQGRWAEEEVLLHAEAGALLVHAPGPRILLAEAELRHRVEVRLATGARVVLEEGTLGHDEGGEDRPFRRFRSELLILDEAGRPLAAERLDIGGEAVAAPVGAFGSVSLLCPGDAPLRRRALEALAPQAGADAGVTLLPGGIGVSLRIATIDGGALRLARRRARAALDACVLGSDPGVARLAAQG